MSDVNTNVTTQRPAAQNAPFDAKRQTSSEADSASAIAFELNSDNALSTTGAKLLSVKNDDTEKLYVDKDGLVTSAVGVYHSLVADGGSAVGFTLSTVAMSTSGAKLLSILNDTTEKLSVDKDGNLTSVAKVKGATGHFGGLTDYSEFEADGTLKFNGAATVWNDTMVPATAVRPSGSTPPDFQNTPSFGGDSTLWYYTFNGAGTTPIEEVFFTVQIPHDYKEGTDIYPHVHFAPTSTNSGDTNSRTVRFYLTYQWCNVDGTYGSSGSHSMDKAFVPNTSLWSHLIAGNVTPISGTGKTISSILMCRLYRDPGDAADDYPQDAAFLSFDIHYECDTVGSRSRNTKA